MTSLTARGAGKGSNRRAIAAAILFVGTAAQFGSVWLSWPPGAGHTTASALLQVTWAVAFALGFGLMPDVGVLTRPLRKLLVGMFVAGAILAAIALLIRLAG